MHLSLVVTRCKYSPMTIEAPELQNQIDSALRELHHEKLDSNEKIAQRLKADHSIDIRFALLY